MPVLTFLGVAGAGGPSRYARSCFLVEGDEARILLDIGEGCGWRLEDYGLTLCDIDYVYISHKHFDHYSGLFDATVRAAINKCNAFRIIAHPAVLPELYGIGVGSVKAETRPVEGEFAVGDIKVRPVPSCHTVPTYGVIVETNGLKIYYTADTRLCDSIVNTASYADLVLAEATIPDGLEDIAREHGHMTVSQAFSLKNYMSEESILAIIHRSIESEKQLIRAGLPRGVVIPSDYSRISL